MKVIVLGSAAGGGVPQWNCACQNCTLVRAGSPRVRRRTQDSVAISPDGETYHLLNVSPDVLAQIEATPELHPRATRHSPIAGAVLSNGDLDHVLGLFSLRESWPLELLATPRVLDGLLDGNVIFRTLRRFDGHTRFRRLAHGDPVSLGSGMTVRALPIAGKVPVHLETLMSPSAQDNVALLVEHRGARLLYASACADASALLPHLDPATTLLLDGTFYGEDELSQQGLSRASAGSMAHQPVGGPGGSLRILAQAPTRAKWLTHINNSNPLLREDSDERQEVEAAGFQIAHDGLRLELT